MKKAPVFVSFLLTAPLVLGFSITSVSGQIDKAEWLIGTWTMQTRNGAIHERWQHSESGKLAGVSFMLRDGDTTVLETIQLVQDGDELYYVPIVGNQNSAQPVRFALASITDTSMVFENPEHDFPQVISYRRAGRDSLVARISGKRDGQNATRIFPMKRDRQQ